MFSKLHGLIGTEDGQDLVEYAVLLALIALATVGATSLVGNRIYSFFWERIGPSI